MSLPSSAELFQTFRALEPFIPDLLQTSFFDDYFKDLMKWSDADLNDHKQIGLTYGKKYPQDMMRFCFNWFKSGEMGHLSPHWHEADGETRLFFERLMQ